MACQVKPNSLVKTAQKASAPKYRHVGVLFFVTRAKLGVCSHEYKCASKGQFCKYPWITGALRCPSSPVTGHPNRGRKCAVESAPSPPYAVEDTVLGKYQDSCRLLLPFVPFFEQPMLPGRPAHQCSHVNE